jgi:hypothetical protein
MKIDQVLGLRETIQRLFAESPFYADRFRRAGNRPGDLRTVKDLAVMPATPGARLAEWLCAGDPRAPWGATRDDHERREAAAGVAWASMRGAASEQDAGSVDAATASSRARAPRSSTASSRHQQADAAEGLAL